MRISAVPDSEDQRGKRDDLREDLLIYAICLLPLLPLISAGYFLYLILSS